MYIKTDRFVQYLLFHRFSITLTEEGDRAVVTLADNAGGIAEEIMDKIFEPYFTTKGPNRGTEIGMFMSKIIIEKNMNGRLSVRNISEGAEFRIEVRSRSLRYIYRSSLNCQFNQLFGL